MNEILFLIALHAVIGGIVFRIADADAHQQPAFAGGDGFLNARDDRIRGGAGIRHIDDILPAVAHGAIDLHNHGGHAGRRDRNADRADEFAVDFQHDALSPHTGGYLAGFDDQLFFQQFLRDIADGRRAVIRHFNQLRSTDGAVRDDQI